MVRALQVGQRCRLPARAEFGALLELDRAKASTACPTCGLPANSTTSGVPTGLVTEPPPPGSGPCQLKCVLAAARYCRFAEAAGDVPRPFVSVSVTASTADALPLTVKDCVSENWLP